MTNKPLYPQDANAVVSAEDVATEAPLVFDTLAALQAWTPGSTRSTHRRLIWVRGSASADDGLGNWYTVRKQGGSTAADAITLADGTAQAVPVEMRQALAINDQTGTTYTLALTDRGRLVGLSNAAAITLTVPPNASVAFRVGDSVSIVQDGAGTVTVAAGAGVTINSNGGLLNLGGQHAGATLIKRATNTWWLEGRLA